jgi:bifunctional non-homologous end joining protein LigD
MSQEPLQHLTPADSSAPGVSHARGPLPRFIPPMLASPGEAFDSDEHLFEIKWDGTRALAFIEGGAYRLVNRRELDITDRYPELNALARLAEGTVLDGEVIVLGEDGKPSFNELQSREHESGSARARRQTEVRPATYIVFDQLYRGGESIMQMACAQRREFLANTIATLGGSPRVVMSQGIIGDGRAYFEQACLECLEGVVAKRLSSPYLPGKRTDSWIKVKRQEVVHCVVIGFVAEGTTEFGALIIASEVAGEVRCVGKVGSGFDAKRRARINKFLWSHQRAEPLVSPGKYKGLWVEAGLYCAVRCMERTSGGVLRAPAVVEIYDH